MNGLKVALPKGLLARLTGSTFAILLPNVDGVEAMGLAEKLRKAVEALRLPHEASGCCQGHEMKIVTASVGVATVRQGLFTEVKDLKEAADYALYQAVHQGHNRCHFSFASENGDNENRVVAL